MTDKKIEVNEKRLKDFINFFGKLCINKLTNFGGETDCHNCPIYKDKQCLKTALAWLKGGE